MENVLRGGYVAPKKAWVHHSMKRPIQREDGVWEVISEQPENKYYMELFRNSLQSNWSMLQLETWCYLVARENILPKRPSGKNKKGVKKIAMQIKCQQNGRNDSDKVKRCTA